MNRRDFIKTGLEGILLASAPQILNAKNNSAGDLLWKIETGPIDRNSPAIASDGTIYIGSSDHNLYAINPDGSLKWKLLTESPIINSSPSVGIEGTVYIGSSDGNLYAINPDGALKWKFLAENLIWCSPAISGDETIYFGNRDKSLAHVAGQLYAVNPDGTLKWKFKTEGEVWASPSIARDGSIIVGTYYNYYNNNFLFSFNSDGTLKWVLEAEKQNIVGPVAIGNDGKIYYGNVYGVFKALNPDGTLKWEHDYSKLGLPFWGAGMGSSPSIDSNEAIYINVGAAGLYAFNKDGNFMWSTPQQYFTSPSSSPVIANDGMIYTGCGGSTTNYDRSNSGLFAVNSANGEIKWDVKTNGYVNSSPVIREGIVYLGCEDGFLYAIDTGTKANVANTPWPMFGQNPRHTSNAADYKETVNVEDEKPGEFSLQNYPNPFNSNTTIQYQLPENAKVNLDVYNTSGQKIKTLVDRIESKGLHQVKFDGNGLSSGVYFYKLTTPNSVKTEKMILVK